MGNHRVAKVHFENREIEIDITQVVQSTSHITKEAGRTVLIEWIAILTFRVVFPLGLSALGWFGLENISIPYPGHEMEQSMVAPPPPTMMPAKIVIPVYTATPTR